MLSEEELKDLIMEQNERGVNKILDKAEKLLRKGKLTIAQYNEIRYFIDKNEITTIDERIKDFYEKEGAKIKKEGIGWRIWNIKKK